MSLLLETEPLPLATDAYGVIRVGDTRVTLDSIVGSYQMGATAEDIARQFPTVLLTHIYAVLSYYLAHQAEVQAYLDQQDAEAEEMRREDEVRFGLIGLRERLLARRAAIEAEQT